VNKKLKFSEKFYKFVLKSHIRNVNSGNPGERLTPSVLSVTLRNFINYCFDFDFQLRYLKPFSVSNYAQKLITCGITC
jgi:hypothetical protein